MFLNFFFKGCAIGIPRGAGLPHFRLCSSLVHSLPHLLLFFTFSIFPFLICLTYSLLLSVLLFIVLLSWCFVVHSFWSSLVLRCDSCLPLL